MKRSNVEIGETPSNQHSCGGLWVYAAPENDSVGVIKHVRFCSACYLVNHPDRIADADYAPFGLKCGLRVRLPEGFDWQSASRLKTFPQASTETGGVRSWAGRTAVTAIDLIHFDMKLEVNDKSRCPSCNVVTNLNGYCLKCLAKRKRDEKNAPKRLAKRELRAEKRREERAIRLKTPEVVKLLALNEFAFLREIKKRGTYECNNLGRFSNAATKRPLRRYIVKRGGAKAVELRFYIAKDVYRKVYEHIAVVAYRFPEQFHDASRIVLADGDYTNNASYNIDVK